MKNIYTKAFCFLIFFSCLATSGQIFHSTNIVSEKTEAGGGTEGEYAETGTVKGHLLTIDNKPAAEVGVTIEGLNRYTVTTENGDFVFRNVRSGNHTLVVTMAGLQTLQKEITVITGETLDLNYTLQENFKKLQEVIVTSHKSINEKPVSVGKAPINPMDLPQSIAVLGQGVIRDQQAMRLSDVIKNVNGVYLATTRASTQENFSARGYSFSSSNLFKNGARINSGAMPEMSSLESVEVLKGSSAILYGQVSPGGIVNMITKQPKFNFGGEVSFRAGSYDLYKPAFDVYGPLSSSVAYRINGTFETAKSYRDVVSSDRYYVNPSFLFKLGEKTHLVIEGDYLKHNFTPDFGTGSLGGTKIANLSRSAFLGTTWQYAKTTQATTTATLKHSINDNWNINTSLSYQNYARDYFSTERIQADSVGDWIRPLGRTNTNEDYYVGQVNLTGKFKTKGLEHTLLAGVDADRYLTTNYTYSFPAVAGLPAGSYDKINILNPSKFAQRTDIPVTEKIRRVDLPINRGGIYVQDLVKLSSKLNVLAGLRYSYVYSDQPDSTNLLTNAKSKGNSKYDNAISPRLGVVYKPLTTTSIFVSYSNSFAVNTGIDIDGNTLDPSIIDQYEVGVKNDFFKGKLSANVTAYRIKNNNLSQTAPYLKDGVTANNNSAIKALVGETTSDGVEVDLSGHPATGLDIIAGYSYNFIRYTKTPKAVGNYIEGEKLVNNPAHTANTTIFYTFKNSRLKGLKLGASAFYIGKRYGGWNTDITKMTPVVEYRSRLIPVDGFATIDLSAGYTFNKISVLAKVSNLTNSFNYYVHENYSINPIPPTQLVATVAYKF
ncbi:MAG: TonB-dependent receptor [Segetibacter sp.]|nr:TonB-dependent receptor [Segetibacter sp.]